MLPHQRVVCRLNVFTPCEGVPVHLTTVGLGTSGTWTLGPLGEIALMGLRSSLATRLAPYGPDPTKAWLVAVIVVGDHIVPEAPILR